MKHASQITYGEAYIGLRFEFSEYTYNEGDVISVGIVDDVRVTKTGRIQLTVNGAAWSHKPCSINKTLQP